MSALISNLLHRASMCPLACSFKVLLMACCVYTFYIAVSHRTDVAPYLFTLLVGMIGLVASLALAFHWNCQLRNRGEND